MLLTIQPPFLRVYLVGSFRNAKVQMFEVFLLAFCLLCMHLMVAVDNFPPPTLGLPVFVAESADLAVLPSAVSAGRPVGLCIACMRA